MSKTLARTKQKPSESCLLPAVLIQSFDGYKRFWTPALESALKYLPKEVPIYFASNHFDNPPQIIHQVGERVRLLKTGNGPFAIRAFRAIRQIPSQVTEILYFQEDMWLDKPLGNREIEEWCAELRRFKLLSLKLCRGSFIESEILKGDCSTATRLSARFQLFGKKAYCMSHHVTLFNREFFSNSFLLAYVFLRAAPFEHEYFISNILKQSSRDSTDEKSSVAIGVYIDEPPVSYVHASEKGKLTIAGIRWLAEHNITFDDNV